MSEILFNIWRNMCRAREFDEQVYRAIESTRVGCFAYLSSGQEAIAASVAEAFRGYKPNIFCQHRSHAAYISLGGDVDRLRRELVSGHGGDPMIHDPNIKFFGHSGLVGDQAPIAVGYAFARREPVVCFLGDSTVEEDSFWPSVGFAVSRALPVLFICEDNGLSVITRTEKRRSWSAVDVARAYCMDVYNSIDDPLDICDMATQFIYKQNGPMFAEIQCCRKYRHVGIGVDNEMAWDRMRITREQLHKIDLERTKKIESEAISEMAEVWEA